MTTKVKTAIGTEAGRYQGHGYICGVCRKLPYAPVVTIGAKRYCKCHCHFPPQALLINKKMGASSS